MTIPLYTDFEYTNLCQFGLVKNGVSNYLMKRRPMDELVDLYGEYSSDLSATAITITLLPFIQNKLDELQIRKAIEIALHDTLVDKYILYPDTDKGKFHYHGVIIHPERLKHKLKNYFTKNIGYIKYEYLSDPDYWYKYMRKAKGFKSRKHPIPLEEDIYPDNLIELYALSK